MGPRSARPQRFGLPLERAARRALSRIVLALLALALQPALAFADPWYRPEPVLGVVDAGRQGDLARQANVGWDRVLFLWQEIQPSDPTDWYLERYLDRSGLRKTLESGLPIVAVVQGTPAWAAGSAGDGAGAVPTGLDYPVDDPRNTLGRFMLRLANTYKGRIQAWVIWNEPDFRPGDSGTWWTWAGNTEDLFKVVRTGYRAVKRVDPGATVVFPATTYFVDAVNQRELYLARVLREAAKDPEAARNGYYFDAVAVNLYCAPDVIYRVPALYAAILARYGLSKPVWLTETNCPVYNDAAAPLEPRARISTSEQAAYLIQAVALARAAGYQRIGWYGMVDHDANSGIADRWGLLRPDRSPRPAFQAFEVAARYLGDASQLARFAPVGSPADAGTWPVWRVVLDDLGEQQRVQVLWRGAGGPRTVRVEQFGGVAYLVDVLGRTSQPTQTAGWWEVPLPPARVAQPSDPPGYPSVGDPVLLVETGLASTRALAAPLARF